MASTVAVEVPVDDLLREVWRRLQDTIANAEGMAGAVGYLFACWQLGLVNDLEHEAWRERFKRCPDGGEGACHSPRAWCNYCGDILECPNGDGCCTVLEGDAR